MYSWDFTTMLMIVAAAAYYVAQSIYKTVKEASTKGCSGCCSGCSLQKMDTLNKK
ncbi:MAG: FeoB-associated Cys-rich membrane protein [Desulfuromusa sp.]|nr:FeoB-associated Cys-rich membrane protein [Desulfuromusa sp.]